MEFIDWRALEVIFLRESDNFHNYGGAKGNYEDAESNLSHNKRPTMHQIVYGYFYFHPYISITH